MRMADDWKYRLLAAIDRDGRNDKEISLAAGLGQNFVNQFRHGTREPKTKQVLKLADALGVSLTHIFLGEDVTRQDEEFFQLLRESSPEGRDAVLRLLRSLRAPR
jgi:transcriptional regulator with XRE-family HTH domain